MFFSNAFTGKNEFWRYLFTIFIVAAASQFIGAIPLVVIISMKMMQGYSMNSSNPMDFEALGIDMNLGLFLMIFTFITGLAALILCIKYLHKKKITSVLTGRKSFDWKRFFFAMLVWGSIMAVFTFGHSLLDPENYQLNYQPHLFWPMVAIAVLFLPFQTSFEEILFRGYLMQALGIATRTRWVPLVVTSVIFGTMHITNPEVKEFGVGIALPQYIFFGLIFGLLVVMDDGLELSLGVHAINNIFLSIFVTHKSSKKIKHMVFQFSTQSAIELFYCYKIT